MNEWGIDVSRWQGNFNFTKAKQEGIKFAILKAGGGDAGLYKDGKFERNYAECQKLSIPVGAYFFGKAMDIPTAQKEAEYFLSLIRGKKYPMGVWYDVEAKMLNAGNLLSVVNAFVDTVNRGGFKCGVYASESTFKGKLKGLNCDKWVARWAKSKPTIQCLIWQFGGETNLIRSNKVAGQTCDQNYYFGTIEQTTVSQPTNNVSQKGEYNMPQIKKGSKGKAVRIWQIIIGVKDDGIFGAATEAATIKYQKKNSLSPDGIVGKNTWNFALNHLS